MSARKNNRFQRLLRIYFRRFRICSWLLILTVLAALFYLNQIGLPEFVKKPLLEKLHARGIDLQFTRLRLRFDRGLVADNVRFGTPDNPASPQLALKEIQLRLDYAALMKRRLRVDSLVLRGGELNWPLATSNEIPRKLAVENLQTELQLLPGDVWKLDKFQAHFGGADFQLSGTITNASAIRDWKYFHAQKGPRTARTNVLERQLERIADTIEQLHFATPPELNLEIHGDARAPSSFTGHLALRADGAETPWGTVDRGMLFIRLISAEPRGLPRLELTLSASSAHTRWATATNLNIDFHALAENGGTNFNAELKFTAARLGSKWGDASDVQFIGQWLHSPTNAIPISGHGEIHIAQADTIWGRGKQLQFFSWLSTPAKIVKTDSSWEWWTKIAPYGLDVDCRAGEIESPKLSATNILCAAQWRAPHLQISKISAKLYGGSLTAQANLAVDTREFSFSGSSDFDAQKISPLLTRQGQHWISQFSWEKPPKLAAEGALVLPAWTNHHPDWRAEVKPTVELRGHVVAEKAAFRGVPFDAAELHFSYTNEVWRLPDLVATRPEGRLELFHESNDETHEYLFKFHSTIDPKIARPLLTRTEKRWFDLAKFSGPPVIDAEVRGRWRDLESISANGHFAATNLSFRGESIGGVQSTILLTNKFLAFIEPSLERGTQHMSAASLVVNWGVEKVFITNGVSTADPSAVARAIGPVVERGFEPYHFLQPPLAYVHGAIPFHPGGGADLHFDVDGGPFEWWKFKMPRITGKIDWVGDNLSLQNVRSDFYFGQASGDAEFNFNKETGTGCQFDVTVTNANLHLLMNDLSSGTNRLEGWLSGRLTVMRGEPGEPKTWEGVGRASLRDGLIWEIPVFGIFTPVLDTILPGLGSSRASEGAASFVVTNGVVHSDDLEIRASGARLQYRGDVDFDGQINARVEAALLRDTWVVGRVLSLALWPVSKVFEYKVSGTLAKPKMEPLYLVPRLIMIPLHPIETMKELLAKPPEQTNTNAPPAQSDQPSR
jgi:hypothetical protein